MVSARKKRAKRVRAQRARILQGSGAYTEQKNTRLGRALRGLGSWGGASLGAMIGHPGAGGMLGSDLGAAISKWLGSGAYQVRVNSILSPDKTIPMMHQAGQSVIIRHKEFVCDVVSGATGTPSSFDIGRTFYLNPGNVQSFPWLSTIAKQFQEYTWRGVVFHYVSTSGESVASSNTALGTVMLHTDYRVTAQSPVCKAELLNEYFASDSKPSDSFVHPIECDPRENPYNVQYVRTGGVPTGEDPKSYDLGKVHVATVGMPAASTNVGELWVTYECELRKPQVNSFDGSSSSVRSAGLLSTSNFMGASISTANWTNYDIPVTIVGNVLTFPRGIIGKFQVIYACYGTTQTSAFDPTTYNNCDHVPVYVDSDYEYKSLTTAATDYTIVCVGVETKSSALDANLTFNPTTMTSVSNASLWIMRM